MGLKIKVVQNLQDSNFDGGGLAILGLKIKGVQNLQDSWGTFWFVGVKLSRGVWILKKEKPSLALESTIGGRDVRLFVLVTLNRQKDKKTQKDNKKRQQKKTKKDILFCLFCPFCCLFLSFFVVFFCPFLMSFLSLSR